MRRILLPIAVLALVAVGCMGGSSASPTVVSPAIPLPATSLLVRYPVGRVVSKEVNVPSCPAGATCHVHLIHYDCGSNRYCPSSGRELIARRHLTCSPAGGDYADPAATCAALDDLINQEGKPTAVVCGCPGIVAGYVQAAARGRYTGAPKLLRLDFCSLCGQGPAVTHDADALMPQT